jgi:hypothetical protein
LLAAIINPEENGFVQSVTTRKEELHLLGICGMILSLVFREKRLYTG